MTLIAAIRQDGKVWMGGDRGAWYGTLELTIPPKVFLHAHGYLIGASGPTRFCDLLQAADFPMPPNESLRDLDRFMKISFVDEVRRLLREHGAMGIKDGREFSDDSVALVGVQGHLFMLDSFFGCTRLDQPFAAVGGPIFIAYGSLEATEGERDPQKRLEKVFHAANKWTDSVKEPFDYLDL